MMCQAGKAFRRGHLHDMAIEGPCSGRKCDHAGVAIQDEEWGVLQAGQRRVIRRKRPTRVDVSCRHHDATAAVGLW